MDNWKEKYDELLKIHKDTLSLEDRWHKGFQDACKQLEDAHSDLLLIGEKTGLSEQEMTNLDITELTNLIVETLEADKKT